MTLTFLLDYQQISRTDKSIVVAGSVNYLRAKFSPKSDDWQLPVTALFNDMAVLLDEDWECTVPWEVVQHAGSFTVSAFCGSLQTANTVTVPVVASGYKNGETPPEPTPDVYNQILGVMQDAKDAAETAQEAAGIAQDAAEHAPTIIDGVWHEWDAEAGEYKSTGTQAQGPRGEQGPKGDKGDKGDKGEKGDTGSQGPQGVPGTAATITIGSVTESAPGGDASVTNSGTATAAVLDFVIPRGETGPVGATGATGPAGLGVPQPTADDAGKIPVVNADGSGYELGNPAPEVDDTLSISGAPADAAATGQAIESVSPDDESVGAKPWSSLQIIDTLCPPLEVAGNPVQCYPVANYPLGVKASWEPRQEGEGDPSLENVRSIVGMDFIQIYQHVPDNTDDLAGLSWKDIQNIVRAGAGPAIIPIGYQFMVNHSVYGTQPWAVLGHNVHKNAHNEDSPTMTIGSVPVLGTLQFDVPEAFYYAETQLAAGTYNFTIGTTYSQWAAGTYQFTLTEAVPAGGQLRINGYADGAITTRTVQSFASRTATSAIESVAITTGSEGTSLGTFGEGALNHSQRISYGSNNYKESAMRQFLNSAAAAGNVWEPQTKFDRPPSWMTTTAGFLNGLDAELQEVLCDVTVPCGSNNVYEAPDSTVTKGGTYTVTDKIFFLSNREIGFTSDIDDGTTVLPYYDGATNADRIKYNASSVAANWWERTPHSGGAYYVRLVGTDGSLDDGTANFAGGLAPACTIG